MVDEVAAARGLDLRHVRFPIPDQHVVADHAYDEVLEIIDEAKGRGVAYLHCWGGIGRTGTVVGCLLADGGTRCDEVLAKLIDLRAGTRKASRRSPENGRQRAVIERRSAGRPGDRRR